MHVNTVGSKRVSLIVSMLMMMVLLLQALPVQAKTTVRAKVKTAGTKLYKSTKNTKVFVHLKKGTVVTVVSEGNKWVKAKAQGKSGYIPKSALTKLKNKTLKLEAKKVKKKKKPSMRTLKPGTKGQAVKKVQTRLASKGYLGKSSSTGKYGSGTAKAVREFQILNGLSASGTASVTTQKILFSSKARTKPRVSIEPWGSSGIDSRFPYRGTATIVDLKTGTRIRIRRLYGSNHCDVEPKTKADTAKLKKIYRGKWSWASRGVLLIASGKCYAAAINSMPHGGEISHTNGYPGQFCLHLNDSRTHGTDKINTEHQTNIRKVYNYFS